MKNVCSLHYRILSTLLLCMTLFLASTSFAGELEDLTVKANQGDADAQLNLGNRYYNGEGVPQDYKQAVYWYTKAAEQGYASAQFNLGLMYGNGQGVPQDYKQAYIWFSLAAANGEENAVKARDIAQSKLTHQGLAEAQKEAKSIFYRIEASKK